MSLDMLSKYIHIFSNLHQNQNPNWGKAPHKPVLLLAVLHEIDKGHIPSNLIALTPSLAEAFSFYWDQLVPPDTWRDKIALPFRHLVFDSFWTLTKNGEPVLSATLGNSPTIKQMTIEVDGAVLADDLWQLLHDRTALHALRAHLLQYHFGRQYSDIQPQIPINLIDYEIEKLKAEAQSKFRINKVSEPTDSAGYYVRHTLFPKVIKQLYRDACAVCALSTHVEGGNGLIDAAHIKPFAEFHNDDPCNGIALCKNHHWGFDAGWFTISDEYRIVVSPHLRDGLPYVTAGLPLHLPDNIQHCPAPDALNWHRNIKYLK